MRAVTGATNRVVIVGAGLAGLSAALWLASTGRQVTVVERGSGPGGCAGRREVGGFQFDTGPTVVTMPELIDETLAAVGENITDRLPLTRLSPAYRAHYADGTTLDVHADVARMEAEIERLCGAREAAGYRRLVHFAEQIYHLEMPHFINRNVGSLRDLRIGPLLRLARLGGFRTLAGKVNELLHDDRTRRLFSFQAMYAGVSPYQALALYAVIGYLDTVGGVYFPQGGVHALPQALARAASDHGVQFRWNTAATGVEIQGGRARAVLTDTAERIPADAVVLNASLPSAYDLLLARTPSRRLRYAPSCVVLHLGTSLDAAGTAHHNIHFGHAWRQVFREIIDEGKLMSDPSLFVTHPTRSDPSLAPPGRHVYYVLAPVPNLSAGKLDWPVIARSYRDELLARLERVGYSGLTGSIEVEQLVTPEDWRAAGYPNGTPFGVAHTFRQTGPFRPGNMVPGLDNVVFTGAGTHPGIGIPMVLISGRLAAERITGSPLGVGHDTRQRL